MITKIRAIWMLNDCRPRQTELSEMIGVQQSHISEWICGKLTIPNRHIPKLCQIFECNPDDLVGWTDDALERVR